MDLQASDQDGTPVIPLHAHIRLASPDTNAGVRLLRRGYSFTDGIDPGTGELDAGLFFICFQRDPRPGSSRSSASWHRRRAQRIHPAHGSATRVRRVTDGSAMGSRLFMNRFSSEGGSPVRPVRLAASALLLAGATPAFAQPLRR